MSHDLPQTISRCGSYVFNRVPKAVQSDFRPRVVRVKLGRDQEQASLLAHRVTPPDGCSPPPGGGRQARHETNHTFIGSCGRTWRSVRSKPAWPSIVSAVSQPHIVPSPSPPCASDTGMQCTVETE